MTLLELIDKWSINRAVLASKMGMLKGTFNNKLSDKHPTQFSPEERVKLIHVLWEMANDIEDTAKIDFNEAMIIIANK